MTKKQNTHKVWGFCLILLLTFPSIASTKYIKLQGLDKVTGRVFNLISPVGQAIKFGSLQIIPHACHASSEEDLPESKAFLEIWEAPQKGETTLIFSSWMFASSPALSSLDHPIYDVWVVGCLDTLT